MHLALFFVFGIFLHNNFTTESRQVTPDGLVLDGFKVDAFRRIITHLIERTIVKKLGSCAFRCSKNLECDSFNFGNLIQGTHDCELLRTDKYNSRSSYVNSTDFHYFYRANKCMDPSPCQNNGSCYPDYDNDDYHCVCKGSYGTNCEKSDCILEQALGMETRAIPDSAITASSSYGGVDVGYKARLNNNPDHWASSTNRVGEWLQVDFVKFTIVTKVATQGRPWSISPVFHTKSYSLSYRRENEFWQSYVHASRGEVLPGNTDKNVSVTNTLAPKIATRYIRINPKTWAGAITLRVEFYGC